MPTRLDLQLVDKLYPEMKRVPGLLRGVRAVQPNQDHGYQGKRLLALWSNRGSIGWARGRPDWLQAQSCDHSIAQYRDRSTMTSDSSERVESR